MKEINPTTTKAWKKLKKHFKYIKNKKIHDFFLKDKNRFKNFSITLDNKILIDFSKNIIEKKTLSILIKLAKEIRLKKAIKDMFSGKKINKTENRAVLHTASRSIKKNLIKMKKKNITNEVNFLLKKIKNFSKKIINGTWKGYSKKNIKNIVHIGIGGSHLGPEMVINGLKSFRNHLKIYFISNIDGSKIQNILNRIKPEITLFLIASKTFTTTETIKNANIIKKWFLNIVKNKEKMNNHFIAISSNFEKAVEFGIKKENIFEIFDYIGGRYSIWSSLGLPISLCIGFKNFKKFLNGANKIDQHFLNEKLKKNIPVILALISIWYNNFFNNETETILPYDSNLKKLVSYLQQVYMESNGKNIDRNGKEVSYKTSPIIWGDQGTNAQHSFFQLIYQGTQFIPCDFIGSVNCSHKFKNHHYELISNLFAQTKTLAFGTTKNEINQKSNKKDLFIKYKTLNGNVPSNIILLKEINPYTLGMLIAIYEHKVFSQGIILNIFSFDQWGVEEGKKISKVIFKAIKNNSKSKYFDNSTNNLINIFKKWKNLHSKVH